MRGWRWAVGMAIVTAGTVLLAGLSTAAAELPAKHVAVDGGRLAYVETGRGPPLVLVHGGMQDYRTWAGHMAALGQHFHVIAYSRRNHFPNEVSPQGWADTAADLHAQDLAGLIAALRLGPVNLVAHSSGAHAALFFVDRHPELVRALVINEPPPASGLLAGNAGPG